MLPSSHIMSDVAAFKRGVLQCKFDRKAAIDKSFRGQAATFDLAQDNFYLLVAWGTMDSRGQPQHHKMRTLTSKPIDFAYPPTANEIMSQNPLMSPQAPSRGRYDDIIYQYEGTPIFKALFEGLRDDRDPNQNAFLNQGISLTWGHMYELSDTWLRGTWRLII